METIKKYLDTMFQNLPSTPEVLKAKAELFSMMEDKYSELIREGRTENEAVGTVISEFGNLDELAKDLGLQSAMDQSAQASPERRVLSFEEVAGCLESYKFTSLLTAAGVALCILCPIPVILMDVFSSDALIGVGVILLLLFVAAGVACLIFSGILSGKWDYIEKEYCMLDYSSTMFVKDEKMKFNGTYAIFLTIGISLCVLCAVPAIVIDTIASHFPIQEGIAGAFVLIPIAIGVFMIVWAGIRMDRLNKFLKLNDRQVRFHARRNEEEPEYEAYPQAQANGSYEQSAGERKVTLDDYSSSVIDVILSVYKPTVTCIYLIWSFLSFDWHITWIIWPISGILKKILINVWGGKKS